MNKTIEVIKDIRTLCTHVFDGCHRCASPALRNERFCYYHHPASMATPGTRRRSRRQPFTLQLPVGQNHLQCTVYETIRLLAANQINARRAGLILSALDASNRKPPG